MMPPRFTAFVLRCRPRFACPSAPARVGTNLGRAESYRVVWRDAGAIDPDQIRASFVRASQSIGLPDVTCPPKLAADPRLTAPRLERRPSDSPTDSGTQAQLNRVRGPWDDISRYSFPTRDRAPKHPSSTAAVASGTSVLSALCTTINILII